MDINAVRVSLRALSFTDQTSLQKTVAIVSGPEAI
jgi:hypothetical protein